MLDLSSDAGLAAAFLLTGNLLLGLLLGVRYNPWRRVWKLIHFSAYLVAALFLAHGVLSDPTLKSRPVDLLDGETVAIEACGGALALATGVRVRHELRQRSLRTSAAARWGRERQAA